MRSVSWFGRCQKVSLVVHDLETFVSENHAINTFTRRPIVADHVTTENPQVFYNSEETCISIA